MATRGMKRWNVICRVSADGGCEDGFNTYLWFYERFNMFVPSLLVLARIDIFDLRNGLLFVGGCALLVTGWPGGKRAESDMGRIHGRKTSVRQKGSKPPWCRRRNPLFGCGSTS